jgi:hypothetical protein
MFVAAQLPVVAVAPLVPAGVPPLVALVVSNEPVKVILPKLTLSLAPAKLIIPKLTLSLAPAKL